MMELNVKPELALLNFLQTNDLSKGIIQIGYKNSVSLASYAEVNNSSEDNATKLELALKEIYKQLSLPQLSWMDEGMDLALDTFYMELQLDDREKKLILLEDIFKCGCNRLLIEGKPGFGKTTLCVKLLHDWANGASYTAQFKLAFLIPLKNLPEDGIEEGLAAILPDCGIDKSDLTNVITETGKEVLIVLDGFDELSKSVKQNVLRVVYRQMYCEATVVFTSRYGEFYPQTDDLEEIFGASAFQKEFSEVKYIITGIGEREITKFINRVSPFCDIQRLEKVSQSNPELFQCPLFVVIFTFLASCSEDVDSLDTKTKLYRALFNCIIKNSLARDKKKTCDHFDIFNVEEKSSEVYQEILQEFGELVIQNLMEFKLQFNVSRFTEQVYKLGFLIKHRKMSLFKTTSHFEVFHKSILEFAVAYSIWRKCVMLNFDLTDEIVQTLVCIFMHQKNTQILQFYFGLCENNLLKMLGYFQLYASMYWSIEEFVWELITHIKLDTNLLKQFCNFMPFHCYASSVTTDELKLGLESGRIKKLCLLADDVTHLPKVLIPELRLIVTDTKNDLNFSHLQDVRCSNFVLDFLYGNINPHVFQTCLQAVNIIKSGRNIMINFNSETIRKMPSDFYVSRVRIDQIECTVSVKDETEFDQIGMFTTFCKAKSLKLVILESNFSSRNDLLDIIPLLPTADEVTLIKDRDEIVFNLQDVAMQRRKEWYKTLSERVINQQTKYVRINYLNVNSPNKDLLLSILNLTLVTQLRCFSGHLTVALDALPASWPGFPHLEDLSLLLCNNQTPNLWENIKKFQNLKSLELQMMWKPIYIDHIDVILNCICCLAISDLSFHLEVKDDAVFVAAFIRKLKKICLQKPSNYCALKVINIISIQNYDCLVLPQLLDSLKLGFLFKIQFIINPDVWADVVRNTVIDHSIFQILHNEYLCENTSNGGSEIAKLPTAFSRPPDPTKNVSYIQIQLKMTRTSDPILVYTLKFHRVSSRMRGNKNGWSCKKSLNISY